jgi:hypothetical protein
VRRLNIDPGHATPLRKGEDKLTETSLHKGEEDKSTDLREGEDQLADNPPPGDIAEEQSPSLNLLTFHDWNVYSSYLILIIPRRLRGG